jgi:hypothetical protein
MPVPVNKRPTDLVEVCRHLPKDVFEIRPARAFLAAAQVWPAACTVAWPLRAAAVLETAGRIARLVTQISNQRHPQAFIQTGVCIYLLTYCHSWWSLALGWFWAGTAAVGLFVIGHECGMAAWKHYRVMQQSAARCFSIVSSTLTQQHAFKLQSARVSKILVSWVVKLIPSAPSLGSPWRVLYKPGHL